MIPHQLSRSLFDAEVDAGESVEGYKTGAGFA